VRILDLPPTPDDAEPVILPGLLTGLGIVRRMDPDYQTSMDSGLTESLEDFCKRISRETP
jgi:hypothetical protein